MDVNPYESPQLPEENVVEEIRPFPLAYLLVVIVSIPVGAFGIGGLLVGPLARFDDSGGLQMLIGAFVGITLSSIYVCWKVWGPSRSRSV